VAASPRAVRLSAVQRVYSTVTDERTGAGSYGAASASRASSRRGNENRLMAAPNNACSGSGSDHPCDTHQFSNRAAGHQQSRTDRRLRRTTPGLMGFWIRTDSSRTLISQAPRVPSPTISTTRVRLCCSIVLTHGAILRQADTPWISTPPATHSRGFGPQQCRADCWTRLMVRTRLCAAQAWKGLPQTRWRFETQHYSL
jgi:hypothetical protein